MNAPTFIFEKSSLLAHRALTPEPELSCLIDDKPSIFDEEEEEASSILRRKNRQKMRADKDTSHEGPLQDLIHISECDMNT